MGVVGLQGWGASWRHYLRCCNVQYIMIDRSKSSSPPTLLVSLVSPSRFSCKKTPLSPQCSTSPARNRKATVGERIKRCQISRRVAIEAGGLAARNVGTGEVRELPGPGVQGVHPGRALCPRVPGPQGWRPGRPAASGQSQGLPACRNGHL